MTDIVERLREYALNEDHERGCQGREYSCTCGYDDKRDPLLTEAADTITTLRAEVERLRAALKPFGEALKGNWSAQSDNMKIFAGPHAYDLRLEFTLADFRRAALGEEKK